MKLEGVSGRVDDAWILGTSPSRGRNFGVFLVFLSVSLR